VTRLSSADLRSALAAAGEWHRAATHSELAEVAVSTLRHLVRCDAVGWNEVDLRQGELRALTAPADYFDPEQVDTLKRLIGQHPIVQHVASTGDTSATKISDFVTAREFHRLELYCDFFRPLHAEDLIAVIVQAEPVMIGLAFTRDRRSYVERDRALLNLLRPHLATAYRSVAIRIEALEMAEVLERGLDGRAVVPLAPDGRLAHRSMLLERWFGGSAAAPAQGVYDRTDVRLVVRRVEGDPPLLLVDEQRLTPDPVHARELGLSNREAHVVALAARGFTDAQIADELVVSPRTVAKHLQHVYDKLGVHSRAEAAARLLRG
jgi:DNA-binding CsgD family transcriptional regulator